MNTSLLREMWRTAASLELLPIQTKTDLGEALIKRLKSGDGGAERTVVHRADWRARTVLRSDQSGRPGDDGVALGGCAAYVIKSSEEALASIAQRYRRHQPRSSACNSQSRLGARCAESKPDLLPVLEGETGRDLGVMGRMFGEELPAGLVFAWT